MVGVTTIEVVFTPVFHVYVTAPDAVIVALIFDPVQSEVGLFTAVMVGPDEILTETEAEPTQLPLLPVTVYVVFVNGVTVNVGVIAPVFQVYVVAPVALKVIGAPKQALVGVALAVRESEEATETITVELPVQPTPLAPVTV